MLLVKSIKNLSATTRVVGGSTFAQNVSVVPPVSWWITTSYATLHNFGQIEYTLTDASKITALTTNDTTFNCCSATHDFYCKYGDIFGGNTDGTKFQNSLAEWVSLAKADVGLSNVDNTSDVDKPVSTATQTALNLKANLASPTFTGTVSGITSAMVGLGSVDNTSDANKPVSSATQTALNLKANQSTTYTKTEIDTALTGKQNTATYGYATLDASGKIPLNLAPVNLLGAMKFQGSWNATSDTISSLVTAQESALPGSSKGMYWVVSTPGSLSMSGITDWLAKDWIVWNGASWEKVDNTDAVSSVAGKSGVVTLVKGDVGLGNVDNTADSAKPVSTATQTALNLKADLASPIFSGTPTAPTQSQWVYGQHLATTQYVQSAIGYTITLSTTATLSGGTENCTTIKWTGASVGTITFPTAGKGYLVVNSGAAAVTCRSFTSATGVVVVPPNYSYYIFVFDGNYVVMEGTNWANLAGVPSNVLNAFPSTGGTITGDVIFGGGGTGITRSLQVQSDTTQAFFNAFGNGASGDLSFGTSSSHPVYLRTNGVTRATFDTAGNVTLSGTLTASGYNSTNWNNAYSWGNHASAGYIGLSALNTSIIAMTQGISSTGNLELYPTNILRVNSANARPTVGQSTTLFMARAINVLGSNSAPLGANIVLNTDALGTHPSFDFIMDNAQQLSLAPHTSLGLKLPIGGGTTGDTLVYSSTTDRSLWGKPVSKNQKSIGTSALVTGTFNIDTTKELQQLTTQLSGNLTIARGAMADGEKHTVILRGNTAGTSVVTINITSASIALEGTTSLSYGAGTIVMATIPTNKLVIYEIQCWSTNFVTIGTR